MKNKAKTANERHWWGSGSRDDVFSAMRLTLHNGDPIPLEFGGCFLDRERAAFCYELEARRKQKSQNAPGPVYRFGKPFPELTQEQKDDLMAEFPCKGWHPLTWHQETWSEPPDNIRASFTPDELHQMRCQIPPEGIIDVHFWFDPKTMDKAATLQAVSQLIDSEKKRLGIKRRANSGYRNKPFPWKALELIDRKLAGETLAENDRCNANNVLSREF